MKADTKIYSQAKCDTCNGNSLSPFVCHTYTLCQNCLINKNRRMIKYNASSSSSSSSLLSSSSYPDPYHRRHQPAQFSIAVPTSFLQELVPSIIKRGLRSYVELQDVLFNGLQPSETETSPEVLPVFWWLICTGLQSSDVILIDVGSSNVAKQSVTYDWSDLLPGCPVLSLMLCEINNIITASLLTYDRTTYIFVRFRPCPADLTHPTNSPNPSFRPFLRGMLIGEEKLKR